MDHVTLTKNRVYQFIFYSLGILCLMFTEQAFAQSTTNLGNIASNIVGSLTQVTSLITAGSYIVGLAFSIGAIMKFKQHKDNPTQIPIGTPVALVFVAAALLFMPSILSTTGSTMFGSDGGTVAGPTGMIFGTGGGTQ